jgi:hypothetical protein
LVPTSTAKTCAAPLASRTSVNRYRALGIEPEMGERVGQLHPAPTDPRVVASAHIKRCIPGHRLAGFVDALLADEHEARHHQRLRARPALG